MRVALYYVPPVDDPLARLGAKWLGRDVATNERVAQPDIAGIAEVTTDARLYGFHATLKPPMALRPGIDLDAAIAAAKDVAAAMASFVLPRLEVADLHGFLALRDAEPSAALQALADQCVVGLDHLRAPPAEGELERRRRSRLSAEQDAMLVRWGYPYVLSTWFFHMTLTRRLNAAELGVFRPAVEETFRDALRATRHVKEIGLCVQASAGAPFILVERLLLRG